MKFEVLDSKFMKLIESTDGELKDLKFFLTRKINNFKYHPLVRKKLWNGEIKFYDNYLRVPIGLWHEINNFCINSGFEFELNGVDKIIDKDLKYKDYKNWEDELYKTLNKKPREYQSKAAYKILKAKNSISEITTSGGKTMIMYSVFSYLKQVKGLNKFLIIVPNLSLILQTLEKFIEYSNNGKIIKYKYQLIGGGEEKIKKDVNLIVGTFQSLVKMPDTFFNDIDGVCVDESHFTRAKSIQTILKKIKNDQYKFGLSGTTLVTEENKSADTLTLFSFLGPLINKISSKELRDKGFVTPVKINVLKLNYLDDKIRNELKILSSRKDTDKSKVLSYERQLIINNDLRFNFVIDFVKQLENNSLLLFSNIKDSYGKKIYNLLMEEMPEANIYYVDGSIDKNTRDRIRHKFENSTEKNIIVASYGVFSTGVDINNIFNILFLESYKSEIIIRQSIGRGMRLNKEKTEVNIYDFVDDFSIGSFKNYVLKHYYSRKIIYNSEQYEYTEQKINLTKNTLKIT